MNRKSRTRTEKADTAPPDRHEFMPTEEIERVLLGDSYHATAGELRAVDEGDRSGVATEDEVEKAFALAEGVAINSETLTFQYDRTSLKAYSNDKTVWLEQVGSDREAVYFLLHDGDRSIGVMARRRYERRDGKTFAWWALFHVGGELLSCYKPGTSEVLRLSGLFDPKGTQERLRAEALVLSALFAVPLASREAAESGQVIILPTRFERFRPLF